jgi:hypothetical protein
MLPLPNYDLLLQTGFQNQQSSKKTSLNPELFLKNPQMRFPEYKKKVLKEDVNGFSLTDSKG